MFPDILQRFENAEVHGRLNVLWVALHVFSIDGDRQHRFARLRLESDHQPLVGQQRWIDSAGEVAERLEYFVGIGLQLGDCCLRLVRIRVHQRLRKPEIDLERNQVSLGSIVQVAFESATFLKTSPAWCARSSMSFCSVGLTGSPLRLTMLSAPSKRP